MVDVRLDDEEQEEADAIKAREKEVEQIFPLPPGGSFISSGIETGIAFYEARRAYVYGLWLSTIFTAIAAIDRHISTLLYGAGDKSVKDMPFMDLIHRAAEKEHISHFEKTKHEELYRLREGYSRFTEPMHMVERLAGAGRMGLGINEMLQDDARMALSLASAYFHRVCSL